MGKGAATAAEQPEVIVGQPTWIERGVPGRHGEVRVREYTPDGEPSGNRGRRPADGRRDKQRIGPVDQPQPDLVLHRSHATAGLRSASLPFSSAA